MSAHDLDTLFAVALPFALAAILVGVFVLWRPAALRRAFASPAALRVVLALDLGFLAWLAWQRDWPRVAWMAVWTVALLVLLRRRRRATAA